MSSCQLDSLIALLILRSEKQPDQPLYYFLDSRGREYAQLTYAGLLASVQLYGQWISEKTARGDRVAIQLPTGPELVITLFACLYTNRIPVPLSSPTRKHNCENYQKIFADCDARLVVTESSVQDLFKKERLDSAYQIEIFPAQLAIAPLSTPVDRGDNPIAFLQYTSGSTSFPKGVIVSHDNIMANQKMIARTFGHSQESIGLGWLPLFHDMGLIGSVFQPLYTGFPCYLMSPVTFLQRPKLWLETISDKKVTTTGGPNFAYELCVKRVEPDSLSGLCLSAWDVAYNGAEHIKMETLERFSAKFSPYGFKKSAFLPCYGLAEATLIVSGVGKSEEPLALRIPCSGDEVLDADASPQVGHVRTVISNGQVMPELCLRIMNPETLKECTSHHVGEIWVAGPSITAGYWQKKQANRENFVILDGLRFLRTGDLGFLDSEQRLYLTGRLKDLIVIDGKNYYPQDIEETVQMSHEALQEANGAVFCVSGTYSQKLIVVTEIERQFRRSIHDYVDEIKAAVKMAVYNHYQLMVHDIILLPSNSIPKTTSGKTQRQLTKLMYLLKKLESLEKVTEVS